MVAAIGGDRGAFAAEHAARPIVWTSTEHMAAPPVLGPEEFPWTVSLLARVGAASFWRTSDLPPAASIDRAAFERAGTRSHLSVSLPGDDGARGVLSVEAVARERVWPEIVFELLERVAYAFSQALNRAQTASSLTARLAFEEMRSSLSARMTAVSESDFDRELEHALRTVVDVIGVDRASLVELARDGTPARRWTSGGPGPAEIVLPWTIATMQRGEVVAFTCLDDLPAEAIEDRRTFRSDGIGSLMALPLLVGGTLVGALFLSFGSSGRAPRQDLMAALPLMGELFANAMSRHQRDQEIKRLRQDLAHIGRVSAMGALTASLAHELNQPLTAMLNNAHAALRQLDADVVDVAELQDILTDIVSDDKRAAAVIGRIRMLLKKGVLAHASLDLNDIVTEIARLVAVDVGTRNVTMHADLSPDLPRVLGDRVQLQQVVLNLVLNALDAMRQLDCERALVISTFRVTAGGVGVAVSDTGDGIPANDAERIFEPLFTTKSNGLGMGLAIARTIVRAHGGRLDAHNNTLRGATFEFVLPGDTASR